MPSVPCDPDFPPTLGTSPVIFLSLRKVDMFEDFHALDEPHISCVGNKVSKMLVGLEVGPLGGDWAMRALASWMN